MESYFLLLNYGLLKNSGRVEVTFSVVFHLGSHSVSHGKVRSHGHKDALVKHHSSQNNNNKNYHSQKEFFFFFVKRKLIRLIIEGSV